MTNVSSILIYSPLFLITLILLASSIRRKDESPASTYCVCFYASLSCWFVCEILYFIITDPWWIRYVSDLKLAFIAFMAPFIFLLIISFYKLDRRFPRRLSPLLFAIPAVTAVLAVASPLHSLLRERFEVLSLYPLTTAVSVRAIWYYVHLVHSQALAGCAAAVILVNYKNLPASCRRGSSFMLLGLLSYFALSSMETLNLDNSALDLTLIGSGLCGFMFYFYILVNWGFNYLNIERREIFQYLDEGVVILDGEGRLIEANQSAQKLFMLPDKQRELISFNDLLDTLSERRILTRRQPEGESGEDLCFWGGAFPVFYHMRRQPVYGRGRVPDGKCVILTDVTNDRLFMERLREVAGIDPLTGLPNRYRYHELLRDLDSAENLPLSVIVGDVNGLKRTNDIYGHYEGDALLKAVAAVLHDCCPPEGYVSRIGGDEFVLLLPLHGEDEAKAVIDRINGALARMPDSPTRPSIALGCATKTGIFENISLLINEADVRMYENKGASPGEARV